MKTVCECGRDSNVVHSNEAFYVGNGLMSIES